MAALEQNGHLDRVLTMPVAVAVEPFQGILQVAAALAAAALDDSTAPAMDLLGKTEKAAAAGMAASTETAALAAPALSLSVTPSNP
jgi:hypothetical protein